MAYDLDEQEQIDQIKAWWNKYGTLVLTVLIIATAAVAAWRGWQWYEGHQSSQARGYFEALEEAGRSQGEESVARINAAMKTLRSDYAATDYAARGALVAASALASRKDLPGARAQLEWLAQTKHAALVPVARLRLAALFLDQKEYDSALAQLKDAPPSFEGLFADRRGDILAAQGKSADAKKAWNAAIESLGPTNPLTPIVKLKLDALGG
ncbi:YfgM family protein [Zwartia panacis]|uniref:YfgM family protein n=1 Tax=Zwartia panacis TaxID=2683345 RepID=UPI0025B3DD56|nr:tetratricopeptide repeat protein [Zwartia panacis]MDN4015828.1 tetratricopeptide repeat protein [Zwartia panacis]